MSGPGRRHGNPGRCARCGEAGHYATTCQSPTRERLGDTTAVAHHTSTRDPIGGAPDPELEQWIVELVRREVDLAVDAAIEDLTESITLAAPAAYEAPRVTTAASSRDPWITITGAARMARVSADTIRRWLRIGQLTRHGTHRRTLVERAELERMLTNGHAP